jgi:hypothetical protein
MPTFRAAVLPRVVLPVTVASSLITPSEKTLSLALPAGLWPFDA